MDLTKYYGYILADNIVAYSFNIDLMNNVFIGTKYCLLNIIKIIFIMFLMIIISPYCEISLIIHL